jgi:hypothetical protein
MARTPEQQLKYAKGRVKKEAKFYDYLLATAVNPAADMQIIIMNKQAARVEFWKQEVERLQQARKPPLAKRPRRASIACPDCGRRYNVPAPFPGWIECEGCPRHIFWRDVVPDGYEKPAEVYQDPSDSDDIPF